MLILRFWAFPERFLDYVDMKDWSFHLLVLLETFLYLSPFLSYLNLLRLYSEISYFFTYYCYSWTFFFQIIWIFLIISPMIQRYLNYFSFPNPSPLDFCSPPKQASLILVSISEYRTWGKKRAPALMSGTAHNLCRRVKVYGCSDKTFTYS